MKLIIDTSEHNGYINLSKAKDSIDGIIARCSWGWGKNQIDKQWDNTASQANTLKIPLFAYHFCYARNENEAILEAELALEACKKYKVAVIYYDMEYSTYQGNLSNDQYYKIAEAFCNKIEKDGYAVGIYANEYWFRTKLINDGFSKWTLWIANYGKNNGYDNWNNKLLYNPFNHVLIHQFTSNAKKGLLKNIEGINSSFLDCSIDFGAINTFVSRENMPLKVGDNVHIKLNSEWYDGQIIPDFVYKNIYVITEIIDDRVVIGKDDKITGAIRKYYLEKI